jgi:hypothetical protein
MSHRIVARSGVVLLLPIMRFTMAWLLLACSVVTVRAQTTSATVVGSLTDSSGARIAGGTVSIKDLATGIEHSATTDGQGEYIIPDLQAAHYSVTFAMAGFRPAARLAANAPGTFFTAFMPTPNQLRGTTSYNTFAPSMTQALQRGDGRIDYQIDSRNQLFGRYSINTIRKSIRTNSQH